MAKRNKLYYGVICLMGCFLIGCSTVLKKEDILLEAQRIKAAAAAVREVPVTTPTTPTVTTEVVVPPEQTVAEPLPLPTPIPLAVPLPLPAQEKLSKEEKLVYKAKYLGIAIGDFILTDKGKVMLNGKPAFCFEIDVKTLPFFAAIFRTKDRYVSYMDPEKFIVLRHEEYTKEGTFLESSVDFDYTTKIASYKNFVDQQEKKVLISEKMLDVISGGYYLRMIPWSIGDTHEVDLYADEKVYNFIGLIHSKTSLSQSKGTPLQAILFKPYVFLDGKQITKISAEVLFSTAEGKIPLRAILKTPLGNVSVILIESP